MAELWTAVACLLMLPWLTLATEQTVAVKGRFLCGDSPAADAKVKLTDERLGQDLTLAKGLTDQDGYFLLMGRTSRLLFSIKPVLRIYTHCGHRGLCYRRWKFYLPTSYITRGKDRPKVLDVGTWNLELKQDDEKTECHV